MAEEAGLVVEVHAPNGGKVDTVNLDLLRGSDAQEMVNMHHDRLALERRAGIWQVGNATPDLYCYGGFHYRQANGNSFIVRVQGFNPNGNLFLYAGTGSNWSGAQSGAVAATAADIIGNGQANGNGTFVQYADKLYWYDAGTLHRLYNGATIQTYGAFAGATLPAGTLAATGGNGTGAGYSFTFNGSTFLTVGVSGVTGATNYTFSCWVKTSSASASGLMEAWGDSGGNPHRAGLSINGAGTNRSLLESFENASYVYARAANIIADGNWHLITGVRSGNQGQIYVDGALVQTQTFPVGGLSATVFYLGGWRNAAAVTNKLTGSLDDCRFYSRALAATEVTDLFNGTNPDTTGLAGWWKLDEGSGSVITDSSGRGNNGTISGTGAWAVDGPNALVGGGNTGHLQAGTYSFVYTYYNPTTAEESPPSAVSNDVTLGAADGSLSATVPSNAAWTLALGFTVIRFYRTRVDGATYFFDHEITVSALPVTETLSRDDETLGVEVEYTRGTIPRLRFCILFNEMVIGAGDPAEPSKLYWSAIGDPTHWPPENAQDIDKDNGDPITGIFRLLGRLYVLKQTSGVYMLTPQFDSVGAVSFSVDAVTNDFGCLIHHSIQVIDTYAFWADAKGIVRFNGQQVENISDPKIRYRWKALASDIGLYNLPAGPVAAALALGFRPPALMCYAVHDRKPDKNYYRLSIAEVYPNTYWTDLCYDISNGCWFEDRGAAGGFAGTEPGAWSTRCSWLVKDRTGQYHVMKGDQTGRAFRLGTTWDNAGYYQDNNSPTTSSWKSKWWGGLDGVIPKWVDIEYERGDVGFVTGPVTVNLYRDGLTTPGATDTTSLVPYASNSPAPTDSTQPDPTRLTHTVRIDWDAEWCRRFCFEILCSAANTQLRILQFRVGYVPCGPTLKAR